MVWEGRNKGIFATWAECQKQTEGFTGARFKAFDTEEEALKAFSEHYAKHIFKGPASDNKPKTASAGGSKPIKESVVVDAAWNTKTGDMEYQGFDFRTGKLLFKKGPYQDGTNNIGEFLAIVHALALLKQHQINMPIYSDSKTAMSWVRKKKANTTLTKTPRNQELFDLTARAEEWLKNNEYPNQILKWETKLWGENPADFGRK